MCWCWGFRESPGDRTGHAGTFYIPLSIFFYLWTTYSFVLFYAPSFHTIKSVQMQLGVRHYTVLYCTVCTVLYHNVLNCTAMLCYAMLCYAMSHQCTYYMTSQLSSMLLTFLFLFLICLHLLLAHNSNMRRGEERRGDER